MLTQTEFRALSTFLEQSYAFREFEGFVDTVLAGLCKLIPARAGFYFEQDSGKLTRTFRTDLPETIERASHQMEAWRPFLEADPILLRFRTEARQHAVKLSDYLTARQLRQTAPYKDLRLPMDARDALVTSFVRPAGSFGFALLRNREFSEREPEIMNLLRPHLLAAYINSKLLTGLLQGSGLLETGETGRGAIILTKDRRIAMCCAVVRRWLSEYFATADADQWLRAHTAWLEAAEAAPAAYKPLVVTRADKCLTVRLLSTTDLHMLFFAEEGDGAVQPFPLEALGLSGREAQVLALVASGKTSAEIGTLLGIRPRSVEKHLENIYRILRVRTRTAAAAMALNGGRHAPGLPAPMSSTEP